jgi:hypothetical protein
MVILHSMINGIAVAAVCVLAVFVLGLWPGPRDRTFFILFEAGVFAVFSTGYYLRAVGRW